MKKIIVPALMLSILFLSTHTLPAQAPETPSDLPPPGPEHTGINENFGYDVVLRADQMIQNNDQEGAMALLTENFNGLTRLRTMIFNKIISVYLAQDNISEARSFYLQTTKNDPELARAGINLIYGFYLGKGDHEAIIEWAKQLNALSLPDDINAQVFTWHLKATCAQGSSRKARALVKTSIAKFNTVTCRTIFSPAVNELIKGKKYDDAISLLNFIEKESKGADALQSMVIAEKARITFLEKRWKEGQAFIIKNAPGLSDNDLANIISFCTATAQNKDEFESVERMCTFITNNQKDKDIARNEAASCSLKILKAGDKSAEIPGKLEQLMASGIAPVNLYALYNNYFYLVTLANNNSLSKQMLDFGEKIRDRLDRPKDIKQVTVLLMDGYFIIGDYAHSLEIADANINLWDKEWGNSAKVKIGAHLALQNKKFKEAIDGFRKYMDYIGKNNEISRDPLTGQIYTSDMVLGFNAMRIGDISRNNLKDEDGARKAYDNAEQYFKKAITKVGHNSNESKYIDKQMALLAARKKQ